MGIQPGRSSPDPDTVRPEDLLGWTLFGPFQIGADLLLLMGMNGMTFTPPLPAGSYPFWVQQLDNYTEWTADFTVEVPEPAAAIGLAPLLLIRARRRF